MSDIPMKGALTRQVNVKISELDFQELEFLRASGVDIGELLRPGMLKVIRQTRAKLSDKIRSA